MLVAPAAPASAAAIGGVHVNAVEARLVALLNASRRQVGLPALRLAPGMTDVARRWSSAMAARRALVHNPRLAAHVSRAGGASWRALGENVANGTRADVIHSMYMNSPPHRANILSRSFAFVGVGWVENRPGRGYNTMVFSSTYSGSYGPARVPAAPCTAR